MSEKNTNGQDAQASAGAVMTPAGYATVRKVRGPAEGISMLTGQRMVLGGLYTVELAAAVALTGEGGECEPASSEDRSRIEAARKTAEKAAAEKAAAK